MSPSRVSARRAAAWGAVAAALYLAAAALTFNGGLLPVRPLFDGTAPPPPYRWVDPPKEFAEGNEAPLPGQKTIPLTDTGSAADTVATGDGQAVAVFNANAFAPAEGADAVEITIAALDPGTLGEPGGGLGFDGNAYRIDATYVPAGVPAPLATKATVLLRYPVHASHMLRWTGESWEALDTTPLGGSLQVFAEATELGAFVAAAEDAGGGGRPWWVLPAVAVATIAAGAGGLVLGRRMSRR